ncbi:MAG: hypothetical protein CSA97_00930 [Bacteroidetes bacterium]|nr:MAG: hypothetical protein CSA97_00930 [Bacteroidota bacterium]
MKAFQKDIMEQMEQLQVEMNKKYQDYLQKREKLTPAVRESKEKELQDLQARFQEFQAAAQRDLQDTEAKLMTPIQEKAKKAMQKVGKDNGFFYIFDRSAGSLVYVSPESVDVLPLVQKELGIKPKKK